MYHHSVLIIKYATFFAALTSQLCSSSCPTRAGLRYVGPTDRLSIWAPRTGYQFSQPGRALNLGDPGRLFIRRPGQVINLGAPDRVSISAPRTGY